MFYFLISRVNLKGSRYTEDILPSLKMTVSDTNVENGVFLKLKVLLLLSHLPRKKTSVTLFQCLSGNTCFTFCSKCKDLS